MSGNVETTEKIIASVIGLGVIAKAAHGVLRSMTRAVIAPIVAKMEEQIKCGKTRDLQIDNIREILDLHVSKETEVNAAVVQLEKTLRPNGGSSIPDKINLILHTLENHSARMLALQADNPQGLFISNTLGECVWVNPTLLRITGCAEEDLLRWNWLNHLDETDEVRAAWALSFKEGREYHRTQTYITSTGARIMASVVARPVYAPDDTIIEWVGFVHALA